VADQPEGLARRIGTPQLFFFVLGDVLGSGIYALVGAIALAVGGATWSAFVVAIAFALLTALSYAELVTKYPRAAGAALYVNKAFGNRFLTFLVAFCLVAAGVSAAGALASAFAPYFQTFANVPLLLVACVFVVVLGLINFRGISESVWVNLTMSVIELTGLAIVLVIGAAVLVGGDANLARPFEFSGDGNPILIAFGGATLAFFAMIGFENAANVAEETRNPSRAYPVALLGGIFTAGLLYLLVSFVASMVVPTGTLANSDRALLEVVRAVSVPGLETLFAVIALAAITNTALVALIMASRVLYGMAKEGIMPRLLARTHRTRQTPWISIVLVTAITVALLIGAGSGGVGTLASATVVFILLVFILVNLSVLILRRDHVDHEHFTTPAALPVLGILVCVGLLVNQIFTDWSVFLYCLPMLGVGVLLFVVNNAVQRRLDRRIVREEPLGKKS
jgi:amino acid transporter